MLKVILWDWNGTLLDDVQIGIDVMNTMLKRRNRPLMKDRNAYHQFFTFPVRQYYLNVGFDFEQESFESLSLEYIELYTEYSKNCPLMMEAQAVIESLSKLSIENNILSASEQTMLMKQVQKLNCQSWFNKIMGISDIYAASKVEIAQNWLMNSGYDAQEVLFIGDSYHDYEVAQAIGCDCMLVAQGHQSKDLLMTTGCVVLDDLTQVITRFNNEN